MTELRVEPGSNLPRRRRRSRTFRWLCAVLTWVCVVLLGVLIVHVCWEGVPWLDFQFLANSQSSSAETAGIYSALFGTVWLIGLTALFAVPIGVAAAVYLEEYGRPGRVSSLIEVNLANLAGVPSIVYGILGLALFIRWLSLGETVLSGSLTMSLLVLPIIITASREAIRAVPRSIRHAAFALGATQWQTVRHHVLPAALPGILTGVILALSRAIGETAPLIMIGVPAFVTYAPRHPMDEFTALPIMIFEWARRPQEGFQNLAAAGIIVLLAVLLFMNASAILIRHRSQRAQRW